MHRRPLSLPLALALALALPLVGLGPARADQIFVRMQEQTSGVYSDWYNPVDELGGVSLAEYGLVEDLAWSVVSPRDAASGLPTGKRQHRPLSLRMRMAGATSLIGNGLANNSNFPSVDVLWFAVDPADGGYDKARRLFLINANIASLSIYTVREREELVSYMDITLTYQKIGIEDFAHGISFEDDWETPIAAPGLPE